MLNITKRNRYQRRVQKGGVKAAWKAGRRSKINLSFLMMKLFVLSINNIRQKKVLSSQEQPVAQVYIEKTPR